MGILFSYQRILLASLLLVIPTGFRTQAQLPSAHLLSVTPPGGQIGSSFEITLSGEFLEEVSTLLFSHPDITFEAVRANTFRVTLPPDILPGTYEVRALSRFGLTNPRLFSVGTYPEILESTTPHSTPETAQTLAIGQTLNGTADSNQVDHYQFYAEQGQSLLIQCQAVWLDSKLEPILLLFDPEGNEIARDRSAGSLHLEIPQSGNYRLTLNDLTFRGGSEYFYRITLSQGPFLTAALTTKTDASGHPTQALLIGKNLGPQAETIPWPSPFNSLQQLLVDLPTAPSSFAPPILPSLSASLNATSYSLQQAKQTSNPLLILPSPQPLLVEAGLSSPLTESIPQPIEIPCTVSGLLYPPGDRDSFEFNAEKGTVYWIEVISNRWLQNTRPFLLVQRLEPRKDQEPRLRDVKELYQTQPNLGGVEFPTDHSDPVFKFEVPETATYRITLRDLFNQNNAAPPSAYQLIIRPPSPSFTVVAYPHQPPESDPNSRRILLEQTVVRKNESWPIKLVVLRNDDFNAPIQLHVEPTDALEIWPKEIKPHENTLVAFIKPKMAEDSPLDPSLSPQQSPLAPITLFTQSDNTPLQAVRGATLIWSNGNYQTEYRPSRISTQLSLALSPFETTPIELRPKSSEPLVVQEGAALPIAFQIIRQEGFKEPLKWKTQGLAALDKTPEWETAPDAAEATLTLELEKTPLPVGRHGFYLRTFTKGQYRDRPETLEPLRSQIASLDTQLQNIAQKIQELEQSQAESKEVQLSSVRQEQQRAQTEKAELEGKLKQAEERAKPRELQTAIYSPWIELEVIPKK